MVIFTHYDNMMWLIHCDDVINMREYGGNDPLIHTHVEYSTSWSEFILNPEA
jgi:hypothetical protein